MKDPNPASQVPRSWDGRSGNDASPYAQPAWRDGLGEEPFVDGCGPAQDGRSRDRKGDHPSTQERPSDLDSLQDFPSDSDEVDSRDTSTTLAHMWEHAWLKRAVLIGMAVSLSILATLVLALYLISKRDGGLGSIVGTASYEKIAYLWKYLPTTSKVLISIVRTILDDGL